MILPFPADSAEYAEYITAMEMLADEADLLPDPEPEDFESDGDYLNGAPDDSYLDNNWYENEPDHYLDAAYEDRYDMCEYGMEGCCGDF